MDLAGRDHENIGFDLELLVVLGDDDAAGSILRQRGGDLRVDEAAERVLLVDVVPELLLVVTELSNTVPSSRRPV